MEEIVLWQQKWSATPHVPLYLFLGGLAAGTFLVAAVADLVSIKRPRYEALARISAYLTLPLALFAGLFLTLHLGKPERGMLFPLFFSNYNSWMTRGGWIIGTAIPLTILYTGVWYFDLEKQVRYILDVLGIPLVALLALYTGWLLSGAGFVPLWSRKHLPFLFLSSGITTGLAASGLAYLTAWRLRPTEEDPWRTIRWLSLALVVMICLELFELYRFFAFLKADIGVVTEYGFLSPKGGRLAYEYVTSGKLAPWFWGGVIGIGLTFPLLLTTLEFVARRWAGTIASVKFLCILIGGLLLRFVIVWGGDLKQPLPFPPQLWPIPQIPLPPFGG